MNKIGIGILFYNEIENAKKIHSDIIELDLTSIDFYFFDNGSRSLEFSEWLSTIQSGNIKVIQVEDNLGFGGGAKYILKNLPNDIRGYMPGNYKVKPKSLINLDTIINSLEEFQVFKGLRTDRTTPEKLKTLIVGLVTSVWFRLNMMDSGGTPTLVSSKLKDAYLHGPDNYSYEAFFQFMTRRKRYSMLRVAIPYGSRLYGKSHWQSGLKAEVTLLIQIVKQKNSWKGISDES